MIYLTEVMAAFLTAFALENLLFTRAVDIPGLYEKRSLRQLLTVGGLLTLVTALSSIPAYLFNAFFRAKVLYTGLKIGFLPLTSLSTPWDAAHQQRCDAAGLLSGQTPAPAAVYASQGHLTLLWHQQRYLRQPADCLAHEHHLPVFLLLWLLSGCGSRLYRRSVDSLVGTQSLVPHPHSQNLPRVPHHLLVPWHPVLGAVRSVGQPASRLNHHFV